MAGRTGGITSTGLAASTGNLRSTRTRARSWATSGTISGGESGATRVLFPAVGTDFARAKGWKGENPGFMSKLGRMAVFVVAALGMLLPLHALGQPAAYAKIGGHGSERSDVELREGGIIRGPDRKSAG